MRRVTLVSFVVSLPFLCVFAGLPVAQGCARGLDEDSVRGENVVAPQLFPVDPIEDAYAEHAVMEFESADGGEHIAYLPNPHVDVAYDAGSRDANECTVPVAIAYDGPSSPGSIWVEAWWQPPGVMPRAWGPILECVDLVSGDGKLNCVFLVPCHTTSFEFQVYLPDVRYWGDESSTGGSGSTIGTVSLSTPSGNLPYVMIPNPWGIPYMNGFVASVK